MLPPSQPSRLDGDGGADVDHIVELTDVIIIQGKTGTKMLPFSKKSRIAVANLTDAEIEDVIAYLRAKAW